MAEQGPCPGQCPFTKLYSPDEIVDLFVQWGLAEIIDGEVPYEDTQSPQSVVS